MFVNLEHHLNTETINNMRKHYYSPDCDEIVLRTNQVLCDSDGEDSTDTQVYVYDPNDPDYVYTW